MAGTSLSPAEVLLSKRVQEMVLNGEEPPDLYICRKDDDAKEVPSHLTPIPVINFSLISSSEPSLKQEDELQKLQSALHTWGCFQAIGHGISTTLLDNIRQVGKQFFEQPMETKKKFSKALQEVEGYGADAPPEEGVPLNWSDCLCFSVYPEHKKNPNIWPQSIRKVLEEYAVKIKKLTEEISKAMAKSLNLEENSFLNQFGEESLLKVGFNYYSRCHRPDLVLGRRPHSDGTGYTIILQDEVEGLQILKDDQWFTIPTISDALVVLMGDQMEIMSNGIFKSPVHRVVTNSKTERLSVAMFYTPEPNKEIGPEERLINEETPRLFRNIKGYAAIHWGYYQRGKSAIHVAKV